MSPNLRELLHLGPYRRKAEAGAGLPAPLRLSGKKGFALDSEGHPLSSRGLGRQITSREEHVFGLWFKSQLYYIVAK